MISKNTKYLHLTNIIQIVYIILYSVHIVTIQIDMPFLMET